MIRSVSPSSVYQPTTQALSSRQYQRVPTTGDDIEAGQGRCATLQQNSALDGLTKTAKWMANNPGKMTVGVLCAFGAAAAAKLVSGLQSAGQSGDVPSMNISQSAQREINDRAQVFAKFINGTLVAGSYINGTFQPAPHPLADNVHGQSLDAFKQYIEKGQFENTTPSSVTFLPANFDLREYLRAAAGGSQESQERVLAENEAMVEGSGSSREFVDEREARFASVDNFADTARLAGESFSRAYPNVTLPSGLSPNETLTYLEQQGINRYEILKHLPENAGTI